MLGPFWGSSDGSQALRTGRARSYCLENDKIDLPGVNLDSDSLRCVSRYPPTESFPEDLHCVPVPLDPDLWSSRGRVSANRTHPTRIIRSRGLSCRIRTGE
jgi:hypothetical protein